VHTTGICKGYVKGRGLRSAATYIASTQKKSVKNDPSAGVLRALKGKITEKKRDGKKQTPAEKDAHSSKRHAWKPSYPKETEKRPGN